MAQYFVIHPTHPQPRLIERAAEIVRHGGVIVYPTDSCYALGCHVGDKDAMERIRGIRHVDAAPPLHPGVPRSVRGRPLCEGGQPAYRLLKATTPGSYTFILRATREVPRRLQHPRRNTIGLRVPDHRGGAGAAGRARRADAVLHPDPAGRWLPLNEPEEIRSRLEHQLDLVIDAGSCGIEPTTVVDLTGEEPELLRQGKGDPQPVRLHGSLMDLQSRRSRPSRCWRFR